MNIIKSMLRPIYHRFLDMRKTTKRFCNKPDWHNLRSFTPISNVFGFDRGTPIDRIYQEDFINKYKSVISGIVCEIAENTYTKKFGQNVSKSHILHYTNDNKNATIIGDLTDKDSLPKDMFDCFICTVTLNFIYDFKAAIAGIHSTLKENGVAIVTVASLVQISKYDYDRWGDFWRFSDMGIKKAFEEVFGQRGGVEIEVYGNLIALIAELEGISAEELSDEEIHKKDSIYPIIIGIKATKKS